MGKEQRGLVLGPTSLLDGELASFRVIEFEVGGCSRRVALNEVVPHVLAQDRIESRRNANGVSRPGHPVTITKAGPEPVLTDPIVGTVRDALHEACFERLEVGSIVDEESLMAAAGKLDRDGLGK